jgi:hypothetical protein
MIDACIKLMRLPALNALDTPEPRARPLDKHQWNPALNPRVSGSSGGRGAKLHAARSDAGRFLLLRNCSFSPQNAGEPDHIIHC